MKAKSKAKKEPIMDAHIFPYCFLHESFHLVCTL